METVVSTHVGGGLARGRLTTHANVSRTSVDGLRGKAEGPSLGLLGELTRKVKVRLGVRFMSVRPLGGWG